MAALGWVDTRLSNFEIPKSARCKYGKPWQTKGSANRILKSNLPGDVVFINQLTVTTPGLFGQVIGFLNHSRYNYAMVFLDNITDLYVISRITDEG